MNFQLTVYLSVFCALFLSACDGYEMIRTDAFPYGDQRTAGTGVAYVLAKMAPEKSLNLEPMAVERVRAVDVVLPHGGEDMPVQATQADKMFLEHSKK